MAAPDSLLPLDARLYAHRHYQSVFPLPEWPDLRTWKRQRHQIRRHLLLCAGLNARTAGFKARGRVVRRFRHEGVVVENLCIETLPGFYLVGNLYRPVGAKGRLPLVLHPHGHAMHARTVPMDLYSVPHRAMNCALQGMASFAYSMIGFDRDALQLEHKILLSGPEKRVCNLLGLSMFGLQLNNSIKALDYLLSRKDVDPRRVGCTGESGGGTQTYFLAAVDARIKVAAPAVMLSGHFQGGCVCENAPLLHLRYSNLHYAALIAPRPMLLLGCTGDWTHHAREREYPCLRELYRRYGRTGAIDCFYQDEAHNYDRRSRETVCAWMARWLKDVSEKRRRIPESTVPVPSTRDLLVFDRPVPPYRGAIRNRRQAIAMWRRLHAGVGSSAEVADALDLAWPDRDDVLVRFQTPRQTYRRQRDRLHEIAFGRFSEDSQILCRFLPPRKGRRCYLVLRSWKDESTWDRFCRRPPESVRKLMAEGGGVLVPILFGQGIGGDVRRFRAAIDESLLATTFTRTADMHRAGDILTTVRLAQIEMKIAPSSLVAVAEGDMGLLAYAAWARLSSKMNVGPLVADLMGADLTDPVVWSKRAYFPLLLGAGGAAGLAALWGKAPAHFTGVRAGARGILPPGSRREERRCGLAGLIKRAARK